MFESIRCLDITRRLDRCPAFPGDPVYRRELADTPVPDVPVSQLSMGSHSGTHVDAPLHVLPDGPDLSAFGPERFVLPAVVVDATGRDVVDADLLRGLVEQGVIRAGEAVLLRTDNSERPLAEGGPEAFDWDYVPLSPEGAQVLADAKVGLLGVDCPSPDPAEDESLPDHRILFGAGVLLMEYLDLRKVEPGRYGLICLPLALDPGADASPVRAVLVTEK